jgi:TonB-linked SusC/RagA family outer membrane protein
MSKLLHLLESCKVAILFASFALMTVVGASAQQRISVSGVVTDAVNGEPIVGVAVVVKGTTTGQITGSDGAYRIQAATGDVLSFSYVGYKDIDVTVTGDKHDVSMQTDIYGIDDVVVIGYGTTTKKELTGSVASLKTSDLGSGSFTSPAGMMQGKVAGLSVVNPNGADPNGSYEFLLRGAGTLMGDTQPLIIIDGVADADIRNINFQEVESVDVLKDGSSAAIYGTRGTNGVIIITTKRARSGETMVEYDGQMSVEMVARRATPLTASQFEDAIRNYSVFTPDNYPLYNASTDWFKEITRTPVSHKHSLAVSGGTEKFSHRTVLNIEQNQGLQRRNDATKFLFKTNITQNILNGWVKMDYNAYMSKRQYSPSNTDAFRQAFIHNPTEPVYDPDNTVSGGYFTVSSMDYYNPVAMINERNRRTIADDMGVNIRATLNILPIKGLNWDNFVSYNQQRYESRQQSTHYYPSMLLQQGEVEISNSYYNELQWESTLNYARQFGVHSVQALLGYTISDKMDESSSMSNGHFDSDIYGTHNIGSGSNLADGKADMASYKGKDRYVAFFGRVMYNYDEKYLVSASLRRDGSSKFGANHQWGWFPAVSAGWRISRENFMRNAEWVNDLKVRVGYGITGNHGIPRYRSLLLMSTGDTNFFHNGNWVPVYVPSQNANPDLGWEQKAELNAGVDFSFFGGRLNGTIDYYSRKITELVYDYPVSVPPYDYGTLIRNLASISNNGVEVTLSGMPVQNRNFRWVTTVTAAHNKNKLNKLTDDEFITATSKIGWLNTPMGAYSQRLIEGQSLGSFYGPRWDGVDANGKDILINGGNEDNWEYLGNAFPDVTLGWNNAFTYKNWDLNIMIRASIGGKVFNRYRADYENITSIGLKNIINTWLDDKSFTGTPQYSSKYLEDATYLKVDNITLGYNFKMHSKYVNAIRLYISGQNLLCLTGYKGVDPEVALSGLTPGIESTSYYPRTSMITFGLNIKF